MLQSDGRPIGSPVTGICNTFRTLWSKFNLHVTSVRLRWVTRELWACCKLVAGLFFYCQLSLSVLQAGQPQISCISEIFSPDCTEMNLSPLQGWLSGVSHRCPSTHTDDGNLVLCLAFAHVPPARTRPAAALALLTSAPASTTDFALIFFLYFRNTLGLASWQKELYCLDVRRWGIIAWLILWRWKRCLLFLVHPSFDMQRAENQAPTQKMLQGCWLAGGLWDRETES